MSLVATLIANPRIYALDRRLVSAACAVTGDGPADWLAQGIACDIELPDSMNVRQAESALAAVIAGLPVDIAIQEAEGRKKSALIADMDSTMIGQECIDELAAEAGLRDEVSAITARAMNGEIAFEPALRERVALLKNLPVSVIAKVIAERIRLAPGARELVQTMRANGAWTALISGGFTGFTGPIAALIGFDENRANILGEQGGLLTGEVAEPILGREAKRSALIEIAAKRGLTPADFIAVGDGANDLAMLRIAGTGVALHAKPPVAAQAGIRIEHGDLTALLYLQGYRKNGFKN